MDLIFHIFTNHINNLLHFNYLIIHQINFISPCIHQLLYRCCFYRPIWQYQQLSLFLELRHVIHRLLSKEDMYGEGLVHLSLLLNNRKVFQLLIPFFHPSRPKPKNYFNNIYTSLCAQLNITWLSFSGIFLLQTLWD